MSPSGRASGKIFRVIWKRAKIPQRWKYAEGVWIPEEENARNIEQFRTISLLSVECKIFFKIVANRLMGLLPKNYIDTSGGVWASQGVSNTPSW